MKLHNDGHDVSDLSAALESDYPRLTIPGPLRDAVRQALLSSQTHYTDGRGVPALRRQVAQALGMADPPDNVLLVAGEQEARFLAIQALREATLALPRIVHPGATMAAAVRGSEPLRFEPEQPGSAETALAAGAKVIYFEQPVRLSGQLLDRGQLAALAQAAVEADAAVICDEGAAGWLRSGTSYTAPASLPGLAERMLRIGTPWPGLGLEHAGIAYLAGPTDLIAQCLSLKQSISICTSTLTQWMLDGGGAVYNAEHDTRMTELGVRHREAAEAAAGAGAEVLPGAVAGILALRGAPELARRLAHNYGSVVDGSPWGAPGVFRLTLASN